MDSLVAQSKIHASSAAALVESLESERTRRAEEAAAVADKHERELVELREALAASEHGRGQDRMVREAATVRATEDAARALAEAVAAGERNGVRLQKKLDEHIADRDRQLRDAEGAARIAESNHKLAMGVAEKAAAAALEAAAEKAGAERDRLRDEAAAVVASLRKDLDEFRARAEKAEAKLEVIRQKVE